LTIFTEEALGVTAEFVSKSVALARQIYFSEDDVRAAIAEFVDTPLDGTNVTLLQHILVRFFVESSTAHCRTHGNLHGNDGRCDFDSHDGEEIDDLDEEMRVEREQEDILAKYRVSEVLHDLEGLISEGSDEEEEEDGNLDLEDGGGGDFDDDDDDSDEEVDDKPVEVKEKRKWNLSKKPEEEEKKIEIEEKKGSTNTMSKEEEERRSLIFHTKLTRKSNEDMSLADQNINLKVDKIKNKNKIKDNDYEDEEISAVNMDDFSKMMDTMAMQPRVNRDDDDESSKPLNISLQASEFSAQLRNLSNGIGAAFHSEQGGRPTQEDRCVLAPDITLMKSLDGYDYPHGNKEILTKFTLGCVFDGHSGWRCSQFLSQQLAGFLATHEKFTSKKMDEAITEVFKSMDIKVCDLLQKEYDSSGSTAIVAIYDGRKHVLTVANVGDSMCILSRGGRAVKMSKMHRLDDEEEKKRVIAAGGSVLNNRVNGSLAVTRAFGDTQFKDQGD
jgi:serine/threonine protein phosphatase PrpC